VLAFDDDDSDDDEEYDGKVYGSDDDEEEEDGKNGEEFNEYTSSWGQKKSAYYSGNKIENDEDAELEEAEAKALQEKMMKQLDTNDFDLDAFKVISTGKALKTGDEINAKKLALSTLGDLERDDDFTEEKLKKIAKNLDKMTKKEKLDFLQQESPELFELVRDFKEKVEFFIFL
jgi:U3 small nucleolar RNA-associated protein 3